MQTLVRGDSGELEMGWRMESVFVDDGTWVLGLRTDGQVSWGFSIPLDGAAGD